MNRLTPCSWAATTIGSKNFSGESGTATHVIQVRRSVKRDDVLAQLEQFELNAEQEDQIWRAARSLDHKLVRELAEDKVIPEEFADAVITEKVSEYALTGPNRRLAPTIEREDITF